MDSNPKIIKTKMMKDTQMKVTITTNQRRLSLQKSKTKKKLNCHKLFSISHIFEAVGFQIIILLMFTSSVIHSMKHDFTDYRSGPSMSSNARVCKNGDNSAVPYWFKSGTTFSINILGSSTTTNQYIDNDSSVKQYTKLVRGSDSCHTQDPSYTGWIFLALIFEKHPTLPNTCVVTSVITNSYLTTCSGTPPPAVEQGPVTINGATFDQVPTAGRLVWSPTVTNERVESTPVFT